MKWRVIKTRQWYVIRNSQGHWFQGWADDKPNFDTDSFNALVFTDRKAADQECAKLTQECAEKLRVTHWTSS